MNFGDLIPISLFICIAYSIKVCVDAMVRRHMVNAGGSEELVNSVLGFGLIQWFGWREVTPGLVAVLAGATGLGNLAFFAISRRIG